MTVELGPVDGDDSAGFAAVERNIVVGVTDFDWVPAAQPSPRHRLRIPLSEARVMLVSTAGAHVTGTRPPGADGDALAVPTEAQVEFTHAGYDTARAMDDPDIVPPVLWARASRPGRGPRGSAWLRVGRSDRAGPVRPQKVMIW